MSSEPLLSVVVPAHGVESWLGDCLWSILRQSLSHLELIVVDDVSPDRSRAVAEQYAAGDSRVRVLRHSSNGGPAAARNTGLRAARGRYITFVDGDDLVADGAFQRLVDSLEASGSDFATSPAEDFGGRRRRYWTTDGEQFATPMSGGSLADRPELILDHTPWTKVFRASFLRQADLYWPVDTRHEDVLHSVRAYCAASTIDVVPVVSYFYRRRTGSETAALNTPRMLVDWVKVTSEALRVLDRAGQHTARAVFARKALVEELLWRLPAFQAAAVSVPGSAELTRDLVSTAPVQALAGQTGETRWEVTLLAAGRADLLATVRDPSARAGVPTVVPELDQPFPDQLVAGLGLGDMTVQEAYQSRILGRRGSVEGAATDREPLVSVIVPTHNLDQYVDEALRSIRASDYNNLEILVVDDWSTDGTWRILEQHAAQDSRIRPFRSPGRGGAQARNFGVEKAAGEYLAFADGDDLVPRRAYASLVAAAERTGADISAGRYLQFHTTQTWDPIERYGYGVELDGIAPADHTRLLQNRSSWDKLFRKSFWTSHRIAFASVPRGNDILPLGVAFTSKPRLTVIPDVVYVYRTRPGGGSMTARMKAGNDESITSWASQEALYARLIQLADEPALSDEYWTRCLPAHLRYNLRPFLSRSLAGPVDNEDVPAQLSNLLAVAAPGWLQSLEPAVQAILALVCRNDTASAAAMASEWWEGRRLPLGESVEVVRAVADTGMVGPEALGRLAWAMLVRRMLSDRETVTLAEAERACALARTLEENHRAVPVTVPAGQEDLLSQALRHGTPQDVLDLLAPGKPVRGAALTCSWNSAELTGPAIPDATRYLQVVGVQQVDGDRLRLPVGSITLAADGSHWTASLRPTALSPGSWNLYIEYEDRFGLRRRPLRSTARPLRGGLSRIARIAPLGRRNSSHAVMVRPPFWSRLRLTAARLASGD